MPSRTILTEHDRDMLLRFIAEQKPPFVATITKGRGRSIEQNRTQRMWCREVAEQLEDRTPEEVRGEMKLTIAVPILRTENEAFCEKYDRLIKPRPYEEKLELMMEPMDFPVTRLFTTKQHAEFLDQFYRYWAGRGLVLTIPRQPEEEYV